MVGIEPLAPVLAPWRASRYRLVLGVPMLPTRDGRAVGTLAAGATGRYDAEFATLARTLVSYGAGRRHLAPRLGVQRHAGTRGR